MSSETIAGLVGKDVAWMNSIASPVWNIISAAVNDEIQQSVWRTMFFKQPTSEISRVVWEYAWELTKELDQRVN